MTIGIFGFGDFGKLTARYLSEHADILVYDRHHNRTSEIEKHGAQAASLQETAGADVVVLAVNLEAIEETLTSIAPHLKPGALIMDVTSVKVKPAEMMQRLLPENVQILATHPLFGPQSAATSLKGHKIVVIPIRVDDIDKVEAFLTNLGLTIIHMTADEHDREMAWVHALTFFVGRGLLNLSPPTSPLTTHYYSELLDVVNLEKTQSLDLFYTIQRGNPYAKEMRQRFLASLTQLEQDINQ